MLGFAIHTSSPQLGLCLRSVDEDEPVIARHQVWDLGREVTSQLHVKMMDFMEHYAWQDLSFVAVAKGPGGFTGSRVGVVAARTLAQQLDIPLFGVSTLAALAAGTQAEHKDIAVMMPAKREAVFGGIYRLGEQGDLQPVLDDKVMPADEWGAVVDGWERPLASVQADMGAGIAASVTGVMDVAIARWHLGQRPDWSSVMPFYGQHPVHR